MNYPDRRAEMTRVRLPGVTDADGKPLYCYTTRVLAPQVKARVRFLERVRELEQDAE